MAKAIIDARETLRSITVRVEIAHLREAKLRIWIALRLVRLACYIANFGLDETHRIGVIVNDVK